jgi:outer membrane receptor protein involved in Fe transport
MSKTSRLASALLFTTALVAPTFAHAQADPAQADPATSADSPPSGPTVAEPPAAPAPQDDFDVSVPGSGEIIVTGARERNVAKSSDQVISILSSAEIARTGEGNIAGALSRVTGLSVVGAGYVYVRGLGDRYSLALLNGLPLPSPEPLRRVVPLDLFPSSVISSSLVQKSYSVNYPGEFGGGVINLTTKAVPREGFIEIGGGIGFDSITTGELGYTYYGSKTDWTGFDNGQRDLPPALAAYFASGERLSSGNVDASEIAGQLVTARSALLQRWGNLPPNFSASLSAGKAFDVGSGQLGLIAAAGYSNKWQSRGIISQQSRSATLETLDSDFYQFNTDQRIIVNGLLGIGYEFDSSKVRWTSLYIRDTLKQARLSQGTRDRTIPDILQTKTGWYERQLIDTQLVGEFQLTPELRVDVRGSYANSQREAPFETDIEYIRTNAPNDPFGNLYVNTLNRARGRADVIFSDLNEDLWAAGIDLSYRVTPAITATVGGAFADTNRTSSRRQFIYEPGGNFDPAVGVLRPDLLLAPGIVDFYNITVFEGDEEAPAVRGRLRNWAGYAKVNASPTEQLSIDLGVRYENAVQRTDPIQVFNTPGTTVGTRLAKEYWLPAATITWQFDPAMQVRLNASKTIARPQFRELINQPFFDPDSNRTYRGNPLLVDSQLYNAEARFEWYFAPEQRLSVSGFYKRIDNPIEAFVSNEGNEFIISYANAPKATLYGAEVEAQKYFDLSGWSGNTGFFAGRRAVVIANYTYTKSELQVKEGQSVLIPGVQNGLATDYFRDGSAMTGQSDHIANLQLGLESTDKLSQQTFLLTYASDRVVSRGATGTPPQPDIVERPGLRLDFVARQGIELAPERELEVKFEFRNITGRKHEEFQQSGNRRLDFNTYDLGRVASLSASVRF